MATKAELLHDRIVPAIIMRLQREYRAIDGTPQDLMEALESINAGIVSYVAMSTDALVPPLAVFDVMVVRMPARLAELARKYEMNGSA